VSDAHAHAQETSDELAQQGVIERAAREIGRKAAADPNQRWKKIDSMRKLLTGYRDPVTGKGLRPERRDAVNEAIEQGWIRKTRIGGQDWYVPGEAPAD